MQIKRVIAMVGALVAGICGTAFADHPTVGFSTDVSGPIITIPATTFPGGSGAVALLVEYVNFNAFSNAELARIAGQNIEAHSVDYLLSPSIGVGYGLTDDLTLSLRLPYVLRTDIREGHQEGGEIVINAHGDSQGVGELIFLGQYRFIDHEGDRLECALLFGIKAPTGTTRETDRSGVLFEAEHQPGSVS